MATRTLIDGEGGAGQDEELSKKDEVSYLLCVVKEGMPIPFSIR